MHPNKVCKKCKIIRVIKLSLKKKFSLISCNGNYCNHYRNILFEHKNISRLASYVISLTLFLRHKKSMAVQQQWYNILNIIIITTYQEHMFSSSTIRFYFNCDRYGKPLTIIALSRRYALQYHIICIYIANGVGNEWKDYIFFQLTF